VFVASRRIVITLEHEHNARLGMELEDPRAAVALLQAASAGRTA
jgi:hypothetical protein